MKHATKEMAEAAKIFLEKEFFSSLPQWIKTIDIECDDHGWFITTKVKDKKEYNASNIKIPSTVEINGFKLKNCIMLLG